MRRIKIQIKVNDWYFEAYLEPKNFNFAKEILANFLEFESNAQKRGEEKGAGR